MNELLQLTQVTKSMTKKKGVLQKFSLIMAAVSVLLAIITGVMLYFRVESVGADNPISASLMASTFFFICVGIILTIIGTTDIPNFKLDK